MVETVSGGCGFAFISPILEFVSTAKICTVTFTDADRITHGVEVSASSLYEACVLAMAEFRRGEWAYGSHSTLSVVMRGPEMKHELPVAKVTAWLEGSGKSPKEQAEKSRLRELLNA